MKILGQLIDYIQSVDVPILKPSEAFRIKANKMSVGDRDENHLFIGKDVIKSNMLTVWEKPLGRSNASMLSDYMPGRITVIEYINSENGGFPASAGILETYHSTKNSTLSFQIFTATSKAVYKRHWNGSVWTNWSTENILVLEPNSMTSDLGRRHFPSDTVSFCRIELSAADGYPKNQGGILTTYKLFSNGYDYQTYKIFSSGEIWTRHSINNDTWSQWILLSVPSGFETFSVTMSSQTIPANSAVDIVLPHGSVTVSDYISGNPVNGLTTGLLYSIMVLDNGKITVRIYNSSGTERTITQRPWRFQKFG